MSFVKACALLGFLFDLKKKKVDSPSRLSLYNSQSAPELLQEATAVTSSCGSGPEVKRGVTNIKTGPQETGNRLHANK